MGTHDLQRHLYLEHIRATVRYAVFTCGHDRAEVAASAGISPVTLTRLLEGGDVASDSWRGLWAWCEEYGFRPAHSEQAALSTLVCDLPLTERQRTRESLVRWIRYKLVKEGRPVPPWIVSELDALRSLRRAQRRRGVCNRR